MHIVEFILIYIYICIVPQSNRKFNIVPYKYIIFHEYESWQTNPDNDKIAINQVARITGI